MKNGMRNIKETVRSGRHTPPMDVGNAPQHTCLNCGTEFRGSYCPCCGQSADTKRLTTIGTLAGYVSLFTNWDGGILHTLADLVLRPGYMMRDYLNGHRGEYTNPLLLLVVLIAIEAVLPNATMGTITKPFPGSWSSLLAGYPLAMGLARGWYWLFTDPQRIIVFFLLAFAPAVCLSTRLVRAGDRRLNLAEAIHILVYVICILECMQIILHLAVWTLPAYAGTIHAAGSWLKLALFAYVIHAVHICCSFSLRQLLGFMVIYPLLATLTLRVLFGLLKLAFSLALPEDIYRQLDLLTMF